MKEKIINLLIKVTNANTNKISDGYHTFEQLYEHRIRLFIALCQVNSDSWCSAKHSDGSVWDGWFILGIGYKKGKQITYHLPIKYWNEVAGDKVKVLKKAPKCDGHTPEDVLNRLENL